MKQQSLQTVASAGGGKDRRMHPLAIIIHTSA